MATNRIFFRLLALFGVTILCSFIALQDPGDRVVQQLTKWATNSPVEKVHLHFDKPYYAAGDDVWFKAYVTGGSQNKLSAISGILNVELIDSRGRLTQAIKLQLTGGVSAGDLALPDTLRQGKYRIRAYTNYMRNAGSEYFFEKDFNIINTNAGATPAETTSTGKATGTVSSRPDVQFFPESGNLVAGVASRVAFKAVAPNGLGTDVTGTITDNTGKQVAQFSSSHLGMGVFTLLPVYGSTYTARLTFADGSTGTAALPKILDKGYVLSITDAGEDLQVSVAASKSLLNQGTGNLLLLAQSEGKICYHNTGKPGNITLSKSKLPAGIIQFTLFSATGEPLNERLVFVNHPDNLKLNVFTNKPAYQAREKVKVDIDASSLGKPAAGNFSVAVIDETKVPVNEAAENNILASLLLTADLKGYVEQPAYYFNTPNDKTRADLDALMLTQGYRRFDWKEILNDRFARQVFRPESALQVSGTLNSLSGKPVANGTVTLIDLDDITYTYKAITDAKGRFAITDLAFQDSLRFILQARTDKNKKDVTIQVDSIAPPATAAGKLGTVYDVTVSNNLSVYAQSSKALYATQLKYGLGNHVIPLQEVIIREKRQALKYSANLNGPGNADQVLLARDIQNLGCIRIADCLQGRLLGVTFRNGVPYSNRSFYRPMQIIVDGAYVDAGYLNNLNYNDIQAIEVLRSGATAAIYGGRGGNGVIIVTTKRGGDNEYTGPVTGRGIKVLYPKGYHLARTFYSPQYDKSGVNKQLADLRTTIFWKPDVVTGTDGKTSFEYFNAGTKGTYRVVIEGVDSEGNIGRQVMRYTVE